MFVSVLGVIENEVILTIVRGVIVIITQKKTKLSASEGNRFSVPTHVSTIGDKIFHNIFAVLVAFLRKVMWRPEKFALNSEITDFDSK